YREFKMNYPVALGAEKVAESYGGILGLPINFLIDRDGRIAAKYVGEAEMPVVEQEIQTLLQANKVWISCSTTGISASPTYFAAIRPSRSIRKLIGSPRIPPYDSATFSAPNATG